MSDGRQRIVTSTAHHPRGALSDLSIDASSFSHLYGDFQTQLGGPSNLESLRYQQQSPLLNPSTHFHQALASQQGPWNATQALMSAGAQPQAAGSFHPGLLVSEPQQDQQRYSPAFDAFANQPFPSPDLTGLSEVDQAAQSYYAHYLADSSENRHSDRAHLAVTPSSIVSGQSQLGSDVLDTSATTNDPTSHLLPGLRGSEVASSSFGSPASEGADSLLSDDRKKSARRQGVTCDQCRTKHLRCDLDDRRAEAARSSSPATAEKALVEMQRSTSTGTAVHQIRCTRCQEKGFVCTKTHAPPSRRYPRPSRSGKRIEQARILHGASLGETSNTPSSVERINSSTVLIRALTELRGAEVRINDRVMAGSLSLQLLNCFFAVCHMQAPVIDFAHFSKTFNAANGDPRKMAIMSNGGSTDEGIPSMIPVVQGLDSVTWPGTKESKIGTPGTTEALFACLHAWAAHYTDAPIAFGSEVKDLDAVDGRLQEVDVNGVAQTSLDARDADGSKAGSKRPKRKQGVACDTCRLRRVRCDVTERPEGMGCSRCEDKRIKCTDTYIQTKRAKLMAKSAKGSSGDGVGDSSEAAADTFTPEANRLSPRAWISTRSEGLMRTYRPGDLEHNLRRGKARKPFCHALLNHALSLVHKYDILTRPSVEGIQVLSLLVPLLDNVDGEQAHVFADTVCSHLEKLGMSSIKLSVDETNRHAVEHMLSTMQSHRIFLSIWTRDSMASAFNRRRPYLAEDRAIEVVGQASFRKDAVSDASQRQGEVVLSGEMGLSFVIMTMIQIGALSRFLATHIDCAEGSKPSIPPWQRPAGASMAPLPRPARFSARPSLAELRKLERACAAVWNSLDSLMLFFDRCASKAWSTMNVLQPFRPLGWISSIKLCGSLLYLALFRALGERYRANAAFMATLTHSLGGSDALSEEDKVVAASLKALFDKSMQRAIVSCRKTARFFGILLPLGILQTGGPFLKQIFPAAQFLAKIPSVSEEQVTSRGGGHEQPDSVVSMSNAFIDPQSLQHQHSVEQDAERPTAQPSAPREALDTASTSNAHNEILRQLESMHQLDLGPYTHSAKKKEVGNMIEALSQLGYAWDTMDREIGVIQDILQATASASGAL